MKVEKLVCDECGRTKGEGNHWHEIAVLGPPDRVQVQLGYLGNDPYGVHDLCGEGCLFKHIGKLLRINPVAKEEE